MSDLFGFMEFGKKHSQVHLDKGGLCPLCLERYIDGREGGAKTQLVEEVVVCDYCCPRATVPLDTGTGTRYSVAHQTVELNERSKRGKQTN
jgi:hypothetical protein